MEPLPQRYFDRPTLEVARDLIGVRLVHEHPTDGVLVGRIVETEAYTQDDPAFHGWNLVDPDTGELTREGRGTDLFRAPGTAYVYLIYGMYWLLNVVTEAKGTGGAVLIRAVEPLDGQTAMQARRSAARRPPDLTNGPGKLTQAFAIDDAFHGTDLTQSPLYFAPPEEPNDWTIATSSRIGISKGVDREWRFFVEGHSFVSPATPSREK